MAAKDQKKGTRLDLFLDRALPLLPVIAATFWLGRITTRAILAKTFEPAVPLDDAFIHFQYARALAEGRFFAFLPGDGYTSGATSLLWPLMLAPFYALGLRDTSIIWAAWLLGFLFLGLLVVEVRRLAAPLTGEPAAVGAAAATLGFGGYTWFAASGMEVTPLAYLLCLAARLSSEWQERREARTRPRFWGLVAVATLGPLMRPEGMLGSAIVFAVLAAFPAGAAPAGASAGQGPRARLAELFRTRPAAVLALGGPLLPPLLNRLLTGHFSTTTTQVKWLVLNPYYGGAHLWTAVKANLEIFVYTLLDGREWSAVFLPQGSLPVAAAAFASIIYAAGRSRRVARGLFVLLLAVGMALPATYLSFLWNRLRYLWPFAFAWCIALGCLARAAGDVVAGLRPRYGLAAGMLAGIAAGMLGHHLSWTIDDVSQSASAIHRQQVVLGRWARDNLPEGARIGVNDTGAIAYLSGRRVFDVVGLTTPGEARYWVAGPGSRYEHYERLHREAPGALPTHFIVYPHWMACDPVLGRELMRATVLDQTILGGSTMIAYEARYDRLHSGDLPEARPPGRLLAELDVSDLESEAEHDYDVAAGGGTEADNLVRTTENEQGDEVVDGARQRRVLDRFTMSLPHGTPTLLVARLSSMTGSMIRVRVGDDRVMDLTLPASNWTEQTIRLPAGKNAQPARIELAALDGHTFGSMHYWLYEDTPP